jgi:F-type H+-transporting ATPase subunit epsilon
LADSIHFELVTPERAVFSTDAHMVVVPGSEGDMGVLAGHAPIMTTIRDGEIRIYSNATTVVQRITVEGGFAEVDGRGLTVLAERATLVD